MIDTECIRALARHAHDLQTALGDLKAELARALALDTRHGVTTEQLCWYARQYRSEAMKAWAVPAPRAGDSLRVEAASTALHAVRLAKPSAPDHLSRLAWERLSA